MPSQSLLKMAVVALGLNCVEFLRLSLECLRWRFGVTKAKSAMSLLLVQTNFKNLNQYVSVSAALMPL